MRSHQIQEKYNNIYFSFETMDLSENKEHQYFNALNIVIGSVATTLLRKWRINHWPLYNWTACSLLAWLFESRKMSPFSQTKWRNIGYLFSWERPLTEIYTWRLYWIADAVFINCPALDVQEGTEVNSRSSLKVSQFGVFKIIIYLFWRLADSSWKTLNIIELTIF